MMIKLPTLDEPINVSRIEPFAGGYHNEWDDPARAVILYCPGRDVEPRREILLGEELSHWPIRFFAYSKRNHWNLLSVSG